MIFLDTISKSVKVFLDSGVTTQLPVVSSWIDIDITTGAVINYDGLSVNTLDSSDITIIPAPAADITRQVKEITISNPNVASASVKLLLANGGQLRIILSVILFQNESLQYLDGRGVVVLTANGEQKESLLLINLTSQVVGILPVPNGGTGAATLTQHGVVIGNGVAAVNVTGPGTAGQVLASNGASLDPTFQSIGGGTVTHTGNLDAHKLILGDGSADVIALNDLGTTTKVLHGSASGDPSYGPIVNADITNGTIDLTTKVTGILPVANGGLGGNSLDNGINDFRLSLTTGVPVTTGDVTGATSIFCVPYIGNRISLYDGSNWNVRISAQFTLALGTLTSGKPYDVFCFDNSGVPTLEFLVWTSDTARATALVYQDGILVKSGALTRRYLGTFYTTATTTTEDSDAKRFLWNYYNRVQRKMKVFETTSSWSYVTAAWRQARATTTNQLDFIIGYDELVVDAQVGVTFGCGAAANLNVAIGLDSTSAPSADCIVILSPPVNGTNSGTTTRYLGRPGIGRHQLVWLEWGSAGGGTPTFYANNGLTANNSSGILGSILG